MRLFVFVPFALISGVDGFAMFAPYLLLIVAALHLRRVRRMRVQPLSPVPLRSLRRPLLPDRAADAE